jgi:flagellar basal-body rod protein FlgB
MPVNSLFGKTYKVLEQSLDVAQKRHGIITSNVANMNTPGYRAKDLPFDKALEDALEKRKVNPVRTHPRHFGVPQIGGDYQIEVSDSAGVDIDKEMTQLSENNLRYQTGIEMLLRKFNGLKHTITEAGR